MNTDKEYVAKLNEEIVERYVSEILTISSEIVIKQEFQANKNETKESSNNFADYYMAYNKDDKFEDYTYIYEEFIAVGMTEEQIELYINDQDNIPSDYKILLLEERRKHIISTYEEYNNYYRMLYGIPNMGQDGIKLIDEFAINDIPGALNPNIYVHEFSIEEYLVLESSGLLTKLISKYKTRRYLKFMGTKSIDPYQARVANNMSILYTPSGVTDIILTKFKTHYQNNVAYTKRVLMNTALSQYEHYEAIMIIMTLLFSIQRTMVDYISLIISRDYFDEGILRNIFLSYGVDTFEGLPNYIRVSLAKNINRLLQNKGNDDVIVEICKIFGFSNVEVFKFYLLKEHRIDSEGNYIFAEKEVTNEETGEIEIVPDLETMYDLYFVRAPITEDDPLSKSFEDIDVYQYETLTAVDKHWGAGEDPIEFKRKILEQDFNYIETKYISINNMYSIANLLFEINFFLRTIRDNKLNLSISISIPKITSNRISLFDTVTMLFALTSKKLGFAGNIIKQPTSALHVLGFNFDADINSLKETLKYTPYYNILDDFTRMEMNTDAAELLNGFFKNKEVYTAIRKGMQSTSVKSHYDALYKVYKTLAYTEDIVETYKTKDGTIAPTFLDYLKVNNFELYDYMIKLYKSLEEDPYAVNSMIREILSAMEEILHDPRFEFMFMSIPNLTSDYLKAYMYKVIDFFKSYTVDLDKISTYYIVIGEDMPEIRVIDYMQGNKYYTDSNTFNTPYSDAVSNKRFKVIDDSIGMSRASWKKYKIRRVMNDA
ncbi:MAG: hypothetical protein ACRCXT_23055 [Paraclostridium sp.]